MSKHKNNDESYEPDKVKKKLKIKDRTEPVLPRKSQVSKLGERMDRLEG